MNRELLVPLVRCSDHISVPYCEPDGVGKRGLEKANESWYFPFTQPPCESHAIQGKCPPKISGFLKTYKPSPFPSINLCKSNQSVSISVLVAHLRTNPTPTPPCSATKSSLPSPFHTTKGHRLNARDTLKKKGYFSPQAIIRMPGLTVPGLDSEATLGTIAA
jgi:hypothetical protein